MPKIKELPGLIPGERTVLRVWVNHGDHPEVARYTEELAQQRKCEDCGENIYLIFGSGQIFATHGVLSNGTVVCPGDVLITKE